MAPIAMRAASVPLSPPPVEVVVPVGDAGALGPGVGVAPGVGGVGAGAVGVVA
jgi:hypothetical protein